MNLNSKSKVTTSPSKAVTDQSRQQEPKKSRSGFFSFKSILLTCLFFCLLGMLVQMNAYALFYKDKIVAGYDQLRDIRDIQNYKDLEVRKQYRWGRPYHIVTQLKQRLAMYPNAILMIPPAGYVRAVNDEMSIPEPAIIYYYCGLKTAVGKTDYVYKSTFAYTVTDKGGNIIPVNRRQIDSLLKLYKNYPYL